jgi:hypothetical protein
MIMQSKTFLAVAAALAFGVSAAIPAHGQGGSESKYSNIGLKLNLGLGAQDVAPSQDLERGELAALSLGYGVSQHVTLWLGVDAAKHAYEQFPERESDIIGLQIGVQYKLRPNKKFRPYGAFGLGTFFLGNEETDTVLNGGGVTWALGAEYRLVRFLSVGAEFFWKDSDYTQFRIGKEGDFTKLENPINGNTNGFLIRFIIH